MIAFLDLKQVNDRDAHELEAAFRRVLRSGWYVLAEETEAFEHEFARYVQARHCLGVGNGLDALILALRAVGVGPGDEVIVPSHTFIATWLAVSHIGAVPVPVEPCIDTCNIDPARIEAAISPRTRAIIPVHLYGQPADLEPILALAHRRGLFVIEDAAQAQGARYGGRRIGAHGHAVAWSFYPGKNLGALGDGGAVTTDDERIAQRVRKLRNYGSAVKYEHELLGVNSRLDELQAAMLRVKLRRLDADNEWRARIAARYGRALAGQPITLPGVHPACAPVWHLYVVRHPRRDALAERLRQSGIGTGIHYPKAPHQQPAYADLAWAPGSLPVAEAMARECLSLPIGPCLTEQEADELAARLTEALVGLG